MSERDRQGRPIEPPKKFPKNKMARATTRAAAGAVPIAGPALAEAADALLPDHEVRDRQRWEGEVTHGVNDLYSRVADTDAPSGQADALRDALLLEILENVKGLPLAVAKSIVADFEEDGASKSPAELEQILRRKAKEYRALREELSRFATEDPRVADMRQAALAAIEGGDFDKAYLHLVSARELDRTARQEAEKVRSSRRHSEAETILTTARLAGLRGHYQEASKLCLEAGDVAEGTASDLQGTAFALAAHFLNTECHALGSEGTLERNINEAEALLSLPAVNSVPSVQTAIRIEIADLYLLLGYRQNSNRILRQAVAHFRSICEDMPYDAPSELRLRSTISLGDGHVEIGLNRGSLRQVRLGLTIMRKVLDDPALSVPAAERANALIRLGTATANAGLVSGAVADFDASASAYQAAKEMAQDLDEPLTEARAWWGLGIAYLDKGKLERSVAILLESERCSEEALKVLTKERFPVDWATIIQNRGNAKLERGMIENGLATLEAAIADFRLALGIRTLDHFPLGYAKSLAHHAIAKSIIAERTKDVTLAEAALAEMARAITALGHGTEEFWRSYYGAELAKMDRLLQRLKSIDRANPV